MFNQIFNQDSIILHSNRTTDQTLNMVDLGGRFILNGDNYILCAEELLFNEEVRELIFNIEKSEYYSIILQERTGLLFLADSFLDVQIL